MSTNPSSYAKTAALSVSVAKNWFDHYSNFEIAVIRLSDFTLMATAFKAKVLQNQNHSLYHRENTIALKNVNHRIDLAVGILKKGIQLMHRGVKDLSEYYKAYGLVKIGKSEKEVRFALIRDNDKRAQSLGILIAKLSEAGNSLAQTNLGVSYFQALQTEHNLLWENSNSLKTQKTVLSQETMAYMATCNEVLRQLRLQIRMNYAPPKAKAVIRQFGFLAEVFK